MANSEDGLIDELRTALKKRFPMALCYKLHGGPMQPSLPDLLLVMERKAALIEAKWVRTDADFEKPLLELIASKLTPGQSMNLGQVGALDGPLRARVLIGGEVDGAEFPGGHATLCVAMDVSKLNALREYATLTLGQCAQHMFDMRVGSPTEMPAAPLLQMQLRARGDEWHAGHLLGGIQYCGPISCLTDKDKSFEDA